MDVLFKVIVLGLLQGVAELFPISSLGHTIIIPGLLGWGNVTTNDTFLPIVVMLHFGTAVALLFFYWRDWVALIRGFFRTLATRRIDPGDKDAKTIWLVIIGTIPVGIIGVILEKPIDNIFFSAQWPVLPAAFLALNGAVLLAGERFRESAEPAGRDRFKQELAFARIEDLNFKQAFFIGLAQAFALIPGISRSGVTMVAGMRSRLSHEEALRFAFLLATPVILGAALFEGRKLIHTDHTTLFAAVIGCVVAAIAAFFSAGYLTRYFKVGRLTPFAYYCLIVGTVTFVIFSALSLGLFKLPW